MDAISDTLKLFLPRIRVCSFLLILTLLSVVSNVSLSTLIVIICVDAILFTLSGVIVTFGAAVLGANAFKTSSAISDEM